MLDSLSFTPKIHGDEPMHEYIKAMWFIIHDQYHLELTVLPEVEGVAPEAVRECCTSVQRYICASATSVRADLRV